MVPPSILQALPSPLPLDGGGVLPVTVAYQLHGRPSGPNTVLLLHDLGQSHRVAGDQAPGSGTGPDGWWRELVGPGLAIDTESLAVVSASLLGSPCGSTSPLSLDPATGRPYGGAFPSLTLADLARAAAGLCRSLGIKRLRAVVGPALGGMVALELAAQEPELAACAIAVCAGGQLSPAARNRLAMARGVISADPAWAGGAYAPGEGPRAAVARLRRDHLRDAHDPDWLAARHPDASEREAFFVKEAEQFAAAFDPACFLTLCGAAASAQVELARIRSRVLLLPCSSDAICPPSRVREAYHHLVAAGVDARYQELGSGAGHRAWLLEPGGLAGPIRQFLEGES